MSDTTKDYPPEKVEKIRAMYTKISMAKIVENTGYEYQLVNRTLNGQIKRWDGRHTEVMAEAERLLKIIGVEL